MNTTAGTDSPTWRVTCPTCLGHGWLQRPQPYGADTPPEVHCYPCGGTGSLPARLL